MRRGCVETRSALGIAIDPGFFGRIGQQWRFGLLNRFYGGFDGYQTYPSSFGFSFRLNEVP
jgi:hypothetical protein